MNNAAANLLRDDMVDRKYRERIEREQDRASERDRAEIAPDAFDMPERVGAEHDGDGRSKHGGAPGHLPTGLVGRLRDRQARFFPPGWRDK